MSSSYKISRAQFVFSVAYFLLLFCSFYQTTTFKALLDIGTFYNICRMLAAILILFKCIYFDKYTLKELMFVSILVLMGVISYYTSKRGDFLDVILLIVGSANVNNDKLIKLYLAVTIPFLLTAFVCSQTGIIIDYTTVRSENIGMQYAERHGFGIIYATDFAAHILFIYISYYYLKYKKRRVNLFDYGLTLLLAYFLDRYCDARLTELMLILMLILFTIACSSQKAKNKLLSKIVVCAFPVSAVIIILLTFLYNPSNSLWIAFDSIFLSNRLKISNRVLRNYGVPLLGQHLIMQGQGFKINGFDASIGVTYLDSSYIQLLLIYGVFSTILTIFMYTLFAKKAVRNNNITLEMVVILLAISSIVNQYLISIAYNPFVIAAGTYAIDWIRNNQKQRGLNQSGEIDA